jgi:hypothetical protein
LRFHVPHDIATPAESDKPVAPIIARCGPLTAPESDGKMWHRRIEDRSLPSNTPRQLAFVSREALEKAREGLQRLAESRNPNAAVPKRMTRPHAVRALRREIAAAIRKGYEVDDVLAVFKEQGIAVEAKSFREYWRQARKKKTNHTEIA